MFISKSELASLKDNIKTLRLQLNAVIQATGRELTVVYGTPWHYELAVKKKVKK
jgi:hypothetical protein